MFAFTLKKIIARLFFPLPLALESIILGWWLARKDRFVSLGRSLIVFGCVFLYLASSSPFVDQFLYPFEHLYLPVQKFQQGVSYIVVLGGGHVSESVLPPNAQLNAWTLARVIESVRLRKMFPESKIIYSGGRINFFDKKSNAEVMKQVALMLGVPEKDIFLENRSLDTRDEVIFLKPMLQGKKFILVTSASHMPRAVALFKKEGLQPIPSPSSYLSKKTSHYLWWSYFPSFSGLHKSERLCYELLGLAWAKINGAI
ncbi:MAG: ElyC/SanA/YdcF family protein [Desulfonauticus sp.]|nr:ElyC/SanA/YdcF family protein [Desulfonauticus sp.]